MLGRVSRIQGEKGTGDLLPQGFLERYWQKQPLLVRGAVPDITAPLSTEALFALACESSVLSRLVTVPRDDASWSLRRGPFDPRDFDGSLAMRQRRRPWAWIRNTS